jgi:hypothetical protein
MIGMNPSKRYSREIAQKEGEDLARDIKKALKTLERKNVSSKHIFDIATILQEESAKLGEAIGNCQECRVSYSHGELEGFCPEHEEASKTFRKMVKEILGK